MLSSWKLILSARRETASHALNLMQQQSLLIGKEACASVCVCVCDGGLRNYNSFSSCVKNVTQDEGKEAVPVPAPDFWGLDLAKGPHSLHVLSLLLHAVHHFS